MEKIKGFKGFDKDLKCRGFQYEVGKEYEQKGEIRCCKNGFHFCENPFDALDYYNPATSRYCKVEGDGEIDRGINKVAASHIYIGDELNWHSFINACVKFIFDKVNWNSVHMINSDNYSVAKNNCVYSVAMNAGFKSVATNTGDCSVAMNAGFKSVATNTGHCSMAMNDGKHSVAINFGENSVATNTGDCSVAMNAGFKSVATNTGHCSVAMNAGHCSMAMNDGKHSVATNTGDCSVAMNAGFKSVATNTGDNSTAKVGYKDSVAIVIGKNCKAAGVLDSWLVLTERDCNSEIVGMKAVKVDGTTIKADTYYALRNGEIVEVND